MVYLNAEELANWIYKEMQNNKHAKHTIPCLWFVTTAKKKFKESFRSTLHDRPRSDFGQSELWSGALKLSTKGKNYAGQQKVPLVTKKVIDVGEGQNHETTETRGYKGVVSFCQTRSSAS